MYRVGHVHSKAKRSRSGSIIAVPGLGAHSTLTWMDKQVHWLEDENMLRRFVPNARIMTFGYRSQWWGQDAVPNARISTVASDLLEAIHQKRQGVSRDMQTFYSAA